MKTTLLKHGRRSTGAYGRCFHFRHGKQDYWLTRFSTADGRIYWRLGWDPRWLLNCSYGVETWDLVAGHKLRTLLHHTLTREHYHYLHPTDGIASLLALLTHPSGQPLLLAREVRRTKESLGPYHYTLKPGREVWFIRYLGEGMIAVSDVDEEHPRIGEDIFRVSIWGIQLPRITPERLDSRQPATTTA